ncbi:MAG: hypothetical protein HY286_17085 [Planctomycetes bacterium]|nr:hypothetical protein [Planctomycetota bacterium]
MLELNRAQDNCSAIEHLYSRRDALALAGAAIVAGALSCASRGSVRDTASAPTNLSPSLARARATLIEMQRTLLLKARADFGGGLVTYLPAASSTYIGIWPDDYIYPLIGDPASANPAELQQVAEFLTPAIVDLEYVPDRVEPGGLPILSPGGGEAMSWRMPMHMPAAWVRLLNIFESHGVRWPRRAELARVVARSFERVPFANGLVYIDPQRPSVGFGFNDSIWITGMELMSSLTLLRGFERGAELFKNDLPVETIHNWRERAASIRKNIHRLYDSALGGYMGGSRDGRQFSVWGSALARPLSGAEENANIIKTLGSKAAAIFKLGCTRHIAEPGGWTRTYGGGNGNIGYQNGGFWPTGTGYALPTLAAADLKFTETLATDLVNNIERLEFAEWIDAAGNPQGARNYLASTALPLMGLRAIAEGRDLLSYF